jgi:hypothetical protein
VSIKERSMKVILALFALSLMVPVRVAGAAAGSGKTTIAVMDLRASESIPRDVVSTLTAAISQELDRMGPFKAISSQDIAQMLAFENMKDALGCDSVSCLAEIGGALGVDFLVTGNVTLLGETYLIQMQLMNTKESRVESRSEREYKGGPKGLLDETRAAIKLLVRDILSAQSGQLALHVNEEGASVKIDGTLVGVSPMQLLTLAGGFHALAVEKEGFIQEKKDIQINSKQPTTVDVVLRPSDEFVRDYRRRAGFTRTVAWGTMIGGAVGVGAGAVLFTMGQTKAESLAKDVRAYNDQPTRSTDTYNSLQQRNKQLGSLNAITVAAGALGVTALAVGLGLYLTGDNPNRYEVTTSIGLGTAAVRVGW